MQISSLGLTRAVVLVLTAAALSSCSSSSKTEQGSDQPAVVKLDKTISAAGGLDLKLESGDYTIRAAQDERIRVTFAGNTGNAVAEVTNTGGRSVLTVRDTPNKNFRATIEVPATVDLSVELTAGNLELSGITGNKSLNSAAGNVTISAGNAKDYATVDASVKVGDLKSGPFGGDSGSGLGQQVKWSGPGKYTLRASLGAGNLEFR